MTTADLAPGRTAKFVLQCGGNGQSVREPRPGRVLHRQAGQGPDAGDTPEADQHPQILQRLA